MKTGTVKWFNTEKGYGFIAGDDGTDVFVHHSAILMKGYRALEADQKVSYDEEPTEKGNKAVNVMLLDEKEQEAWI